MKDYRINYQLPASPLGPAVGEKQPKKECPFLSFERGDWGVVPDAFGCGWSALITEQECKQINGAAGEAGKRGRGQADTEGAVRDVRPSHSRQKPAEQSQCDVAAHHGFEPHAAPPFKVGDRVRVVRAGFGQARSLIRREVTITEVDHGEPYLPIRAAGFWWGITEIELVQEKEEDPLLRAFKEDGIVREFRVGDRVRCTYKHTFRFTPGVIDMIIGNCARVLHDNGDSSGHLLKWLEHV